MILHTFLMLTLKPMILAHLQQWRQAPIWRRICLSSFLLVCWLPSCLYDFLFIILILIPTGLLICTENTLWNISEDDDFVKLFKKSFTFYVESGMREKTETGIDIFENQQGGWLVTKDFKENFCKFIIEHYLRKFHWFYLHLTHLTTFICLITAHPQESAIEDQVFELDQKKEKKINWVQKLKSKICRGQRVWWDWNLLWIGQNVYSSLVQNYHILKIQEKKRWKNHKVSKVFWRWLCVMWKCLEIITHVVAKELLNSVESSLPTLFLKRKIFLFKSIFHAIVWCLLPMWGGQFRKIEHSLLTLWQRLHHHKAQAFRQTHLLRNFIVPILDHDALAGSKNQGVPKKKFKDTMLYFLIKDLEDPPPPLHR